MKTAGAQGCKKIGSAKYTEGFKRGNELFVKGGTASPIDQSYNLEAISTTDTQDRGFTGE